MVNFVKLLVILYADDTVILGTEKIESITTQCIICEFENMETRHHFWQDETS